MTSSLNKLIRAGLVRLQVVLLLMALGIGLTGCNRSEDGSGAASKTAKAKYHCPMHPTYVSDKQGDCPICNMKLTPIKNDAAASKSNGSNKKAAKYHCPMHPTYVSDKPGDCPICNMKVVPIKGDKPADIAHSADHPEAAAVPGRITVSVSPEKQQLIGLQVSPVETRDLNDKLRATALIQHDETRLARVAPRFSGWVRDLKVNYTGQQVTKGDPLLTVYSPELLSAETEYLLAFEQLEKLKDKTTDPQFESARRLAESARRRLSLWQIGEEEIRAMEQTHEPIDEVLLRAPFSGHVISKTAVAGKSFMAGETLYEIADLSHLWARASISEYEFARIKVGQKARLLFPFLGNKVIESSVAFIYPHIDPQTRRGEVRLEFESREHQIRPDMWANVEIELEIGTVLTAPASALINTGERYVAFVKRSDDHLEPRDVKVGAKTDDYYEIRGGLAEGEEVVTRALFLVDSESQLKAAIAGMGAGGEHKH